LVGIAFAGTEFASLIENEEVKLDRDSSRKLLKSILILSNDYNKG